MKQIGSLLTAGALALSLVTLPAGAANTTSSGCASSGSSSTSSGSSGRKWVPGIMRGAPFSALRSSIAHIVFTRCTFGKSGRGFFQSACSG